MVYYGTKSLSSDIIKKMVDNNPDVSDDINFRDCVYIYSGAYI